MSTTVTGGFLGSNLLYWNKLKYKNMNTLNWIKGIPFFIIISILMSIWFIVFSKYLFWILFQKQRNFFLQEDFKKIIETKETNKIKEFILEDKNKKELKMFLQWNGWTGLRNYISFSEENFAKEITPYLATLFSTR